MAFRYHRTPSAGGNQPQVSRSARVTVVRRDPFGAFARVALSLQPRRIILVSPWLSEGTGAYAPITSLIEHTVRHDAGLVLVSRPPANDSHATIVSKVRQVAHARVYLNPRLHAKLYICESRRGRGVALIGSANSTCGSHRLDEVALLVRPDRGSTIITELAGPTVRALMGAGQPVGKEI
jgi:hypothetical protein